MTSQQRNSFVLSLLEHVTPLLRKYATTYTMLSFDDLYQDAAIHIMNLIDAHSDYTAQHLERLCFLRVRSRIIDELKYLSYRTHRSLDKPLNCESDSSLYDVLVENLPVDCNGELDDSKKRAIHKALRRLPLEDQQYICRVFGLNDYEVLPLYPYSLNNAHKTDTAVGKHAYYHLRKDALLKTEIFS